MQQVNLKNTAINALCIMLLCGCNFLKKPALNPESTNAVSKDTTAYAFADTLIIRDNTIKLDSITTHEYESVVESVPDTNLPDAIKSTKNGLRISLLNGDSLMLDNVMHIDSETQAVSDDVQQYAFAINYAGTDYALITIDLYEGEAYVLINKRNGKRCYTYEVPHLSPDKKHFASAHFDQSGENANGIDIYSIGNDSLTCVYASDFSWGAQNLKWKDNNTLYFEQRTWNDAGKEATRYVKLNLESITR